MRGRLAAVTVILAACAMARVVHPQEPPPAFELATVKASGPDSAAMSIRRLPGGRLVTSNTPLPMLIQWAYGLDEGRLVNLPRGADSLRFDIVAKAPEPEPAVGRMQLMMRALLAERFRLAVHRETRELVAYTLVIDDGGVKVRPVTADAPAGPNPFQMTSAGTLTGTRVTADMLATVLSNRLGRPVANATGFTGAFDFTLRWTPETASPGAGAPDGPSLVTAVREQLGFRLVVRRTPTDVVIVDHLEQTPTPD